MVNHYKEMVEIKKRAQEELSEEGYGFAACQKYTNLETEMVKSSSIVIVFAAFFLEAFIHEFAEEHLSRTYIQKYLERLDLRAKWVIIPRLITGKDYPTDSQAYQDLCTLVKLRNQLAHPKPVPSMILPKNEREREITERYQHSQEVSRKLVIENCQAAVRACRDVVIELWRISKDALWFEIDKASFSRFFWNVLPMPDIDMDVLRAHEDEFTPGDREGTISSEEERPPSE